MCGIFGYVGYQDAGELILDGLKKLEYRGYDSSGIAVSVDGEMHIQRIVGKIANATFTLPSSSLGIGHTRWATHGGVTEANAHPHRDCWGKIALVHNGIVENYQEIKDDLLSKGHDFVSETDSEVIVHLIEELLHQYSFEDAVRRAFNQLKGYNAIVVIHADFPEIIAAKSGSPLVVGIGNDELFIGSDAIAIVPHTRRLVFVADNQMIILGKEVRLFSLPDGQPVPIKIETVDWQLGDNGKGDYPHYMLKEIYEQPWVIRKIATTYTTQILELAKLIQDAKGTFLIGCGTAYNACLVGEYLFSIIASWHLNTRSAAEFNYLLHFLNKESLVIAFSQSGETIDVIQPLGLAREKGAKIVGIVNVLGSTIYRESDYKVLLGAGPEKAVASTKAYIAKLSILVMLSYAVAGKIEEGQRVLLEAANEIETLLTTRVAPIQNLARTLKDEEHIYIIGRGMSYPAALEAALKIKEVSYIHTEALPGAELKHGTIALISKGTPCIVMAPHDETYDAILSNAIEIKARGGYMIGVTPYKSGAFDQILEVRNSSIAAILTQAVPMQLLAYYLAVAKGYDPDQPRNLAKSVTVK